MSESRSICPVCSRDPGTPHALDCPRSSMSLRRRVRMALAEQGREIDPLKSYRQQFAQGKGALPRRPEQHVIR